MKPERDGGIRWSEWLGGIGRKSGNDSRRGSDLLRSINDTHADLGVVDDYPGVMAVLVDALKKEGVRFNERDFLDGEITCHNQNVMVLRGAAYEVVHRAFESRERRITRRKSSIALIKHKWATLTSGYHSLKCFVIRFFCSAHNVRCALPPNDQAHLRRGDGADKTEGTP